MRVLYGKYWRRKEAWVKVRLPAEAKKRSWLDRLRGYSWACGPGPVWFGFAVTTEWHLGFRKFDSKGEWKFYEVSMGPLNVYYFTEE